MTDLEGVVERIRQGNTTEQDADAVEAALAVLYKRIRELEAANRGYWIKYGEPPEVDVREPVQ